MLFNIEWLATIFRESQSYSNPHLNIDHVSTDSRQKMDHALFIPLVGDNFDGHQYIEQAIENGAVAVICEQGTLLPTSLAPEFPVFMVKDTLLALQKLAANYRKKVDPIVVGITGSNGKTTTKDLVASVVRTSYKTHATKGNFNNHIGLPLTILDMPQSTEVLILEMGMNDFGEIQTLSEIARPDYGIITNIGESHIEHLGSRQGILQAKLEILCGMSATAPLILDGDQALLSDIQRENQIIKCGFKPTNDVIIKESKILASETQFTLNDGETYIIPLLGKHHAQNASYAIAIAKKLNINTVTIKKGLKDLQLTGMRFEILKGLNDVSIINDAYNASPTSMKAAIDVVKQMSGYREKVLILGDVLELGEHSVKFHQAISEVIEYPITVLFTYGDNAKHISACVKEKTPGIVSEHFTSKTELIHKLTSYLKKNNLLLFKASRGMKLEKIIQKIKC